jgi:ribosomal protein L9
MENNQDQIQPIDIEFDDILTPQPVREEPAKEEVVEKKEEPVAEIQPADIEEEVEEKDNPLSVVEDTPEPVSEEPADEEESTVVGEIIEKFGYEIEDEFEDTTEGLTKLTQVISERLAVETLDNLFEKFPTVQKHLEYMQQGGDPSDFMRAFTPEVDYSRVEIKDEDTNTQKRILNDYFIARGTEENFIGDMIESYEDKGTLKDKAEAAKKALSDAQASQRDAELNRQKVEAEEQRKETEEMWRSVGTTIHENNDLAGIPISQRDKAKFFEYISKPINAEGATQRDMDFQKAGLDQKLAVDYLVYKGFDIGKFIGKKATTKAAKSLKTKLENHSKKAKSVRTANSSVSGDIDSLDLDISNLGG